MKKILIASVAALAFASPAFAAETAAFEGGRVGFTAGLADDDVVGDDAFSYGAEIGYDFNFNGIVVGVTGEAQDTDETGREFAATARVGGVVGKKVLIYALGGYTNLNAGGFNFEGIKVGGGAELGLGKNVYLKYEHRYANYDAGLEFHQNVLGLGLRF